MDPGFSLAALGADRAADRRLITRPIRKLEELSRQVTREENYARAARGNQDEIGSLADAFQHHAQPHGGAQQQLKRARDDVERLRPGPEPG